jgi:hypothetical protein
MHTFNSIFVFFYTCITDIGGYSRNRRYKEQESLQRMAYGPIVVYSITFTVRTIMFGLFKYSNEIGVYMLIVDDENDFTEMLL